jgi:hypothetical protein
MRAESEQRFPSKIDWWLPVFIGAVMLAAPVSIALTAKHKPIESSTIAILAVSLALPAALIVWVFKNTVYVISGNDLTILCGPTDTHIAIDSITRIEGGSGGGGLGSAPALSLSRISIHYGSYGEILISPEDRRGFIHAILAKAPNVALQDLDEYR